MTTTFIKVDYMNKHRIFINGEPDSVERCVSLINMWVWWSYVGRAILEEIFDVHKILKINIVPYTENPNVEPKTNWGNIPDAHAKGYFHPGQAGQKDVEGTGRGSEMYIDLNENLSVSENKCPTIRTVACYTYMRPEFALMHELVHANRGMRGKMQTHSLPNQDMWNSEEEIAILITNMLMSEKGVTALRKDYRTNNVMDSDDPAKFIEQEGNKDLVKQIAADHPKLKRNTNTNAVHIPFNPIFMCFQGKPTAA